MSYDSLTPAAARLWHYPPDYSRGYEVRRSFLTDITTSRNETEQRRSLRDVPRLSVRYTTNLEGEDLAEAKLDLRFAQNQPRAVPDWSRFARTTTLASAGNTALEVDPAPAWLADGQLAFLCSATATELVLLDYVNGTEINLAGALDNSWPSGSVIRPVIFGLLPGSIKAGRLTRGAQSFEITARAYPGTEPPEDPGTATDTFNGREVFAFEADQAGSPSIDYVLPVDEVDFEIGRTAQFRPVPQQSQVIEASFISRTRAEAVAIEQFFIRHKGRRTAFYRSTCEKDLRLAVNAAGTNQITVAGRTLADLWTLADAPHTDTAIEIVLRNGTRLRRLISSVALVSGNSRLTLDTTTTAAIADVARISWMPLVRFANDELVTLWQSPLSATISASFQSVRLP
jgi:hypothetical protein